MTKTEWADQNTAGMIEKHCNEKLQAHLIKMEKKKRLSKENILANKRNIKKYGR